MTLRMGDGPPANIPAGLDAYAGYVNDSGDGETWPTIRQIPARYHLSITTNGEPADCADVETGAMASWEGYPVGYCEVSRVNDLIRAFGKPRKLWTAHHNDVPHICNPACFPGLVYTANGTQWTNHGDLWDESLLEDDFFDFQQPAQLIGDPMVIGTNAQGQLTIAGPAKDNGNLLVFTETAPTNWSVTDVTAKIKQTNPADPRSYQVI